MRRPAPPVPLPTPINTGYDWNGWYAGGQIGYGRGAASPTLSGPNLAHSSNAFGSLEGGLEIGYDRVLSSRLYVGGVAGVSFPHFFEDGVVASGSLTQGANVTEKLDAVSTLRCHLGLSSDSWVMYGTGGLAASQTRFIESLASSSKPDTLLRWHMGWTAGAGAEFAIGPNWAAHAEYSYSRLGQTSVVLSPGAGFGSQLAVHSVRLGLRRLLTGPGATAPTWTGGSSPSDTDRWNVHGQETFIEQGYFAFRSAYEGTNSLSSNSQVKNTESATAFLGVRLWSGAQAYFDPEIDQGYGLNTTHGVSAFPNGEAQKAEFPAPRLVVDRLILKQTLGLGGARDTIADGPNQLPQTRDISRITVVAGRLAVTDYFNVNAYANDPRTNFLNWNIYGAGAYDWTMDQISWTYGALAELNGRDWAVRVGYFLLPIVSSNNVFDLHIPGRGEYAVELERRYSVDSRPGKLRVFGWVNHGTMGGYADAVALPLTSPNYPDIVLTREIRTNPGIVLNAEQAVTDELGLFSRASWSPGRDEILGGTDCSESLSLGGVVKGASWARPNDNVGVSEVVGGLSPAARAYFAAGGWGILIGDGRLNYREERVDEAYYSFAVRKSLALSVDYQFVTHPAYNADRGPVSIYALRLHAAF
jgi:high affinity Mn2+ porin